MLVIPCYRVHTYTRLVRLYTLYSTVKRGNAGQGVIKIFIRRHKMPGKDGTGPVGSGLRAGAGKKAGGKGKNSTQKGQGAKSGGKKGGCK
jgi:hypothetical protein